MSDLNEKLRELNIELIKLIKDNINPVDNLEKLYIQNKGFIYQIVKNRVHGVYDLEDLKQEAYFALVKTVELYDFNRENSSFLQLFKWCILNRIKYVDQGLPSNLKTLISKYKRIRNKVLQELCYEPNDEEMMSYLEIDYKTLIRIKQNLYEAVSLDEFIGDEGTVKKIDMRIDEKAHLIAQENLEHDDMKTKIQSALEQLPYDIRKVISDIYLHDMPHANIAKDLNINSNYVGNIERKGLRLLRKNKKFLCSVSSYVNDYEFNYFSRKPIIDIVIKKDEMKLFGRKCANYLDFEKPIQKN